MSKKKPNPDRPVKVGEILLLGYIHDQIIEKMRELGHDVDNLHEFISTQDFIHDHVNTILNVTYEELLRVGVTDPDCLVIRMANQNTSNEQRLKDLRNKYFEKSPHDKSMNRIH
ncbi:MAG: hypothetical protein KME67_08900 [Candidatus Thiodiazotropha sp. (ex Codakia orbicularis)]|nr:hypothetical protein [Candidatus Thiodiazotropha sp. (ex Codakia orbicularis)]